MFGRAAAVDFGVEPNGGGVTMALEGLGEGARGIEGCARGGDGAEGKREGEIGSGDPARVRLEAAGP